jgi:hypothetical protein
MSDFDDVLERLVIDPASAGALAADPQGALRGYELSADEIGLLHTQVGADPVAQHDVEVRANQSSMFGMLTPLAGVFGGLGDQIVSSGLGPATAGAGGVAPAVEVSGIGAALPAAGPADQGFGAAAASGFGSVVDAYGSDAYTADTTYATGGLGGFGDELGAGLRAPGAAADTGLGAAPAPAEPLPPVAPPEGYRTRVDVDGDGRWDDHMAMGRADGGVDIYVDRDGDGRVDFIGHDDDADGLVDSAEYDKNADGFFEKRMYDDDGDGWMDRTVTTDPPPN